MNGKITIDQLWQKISKILLENQETLKQIYFDGDNNAFTDFIVSKFMILGEQFKFHVQTEYWPKVDINFFDRETEENWQEWAREVAIEHENNAGTWYEELDKLFAINAGIKVLMTYSDKDDVELLSDFNATEPGSVLSIYKSRKYHTADDKYLFIFGPVAGGKKRHLFSAFFFDGQKVVQLPETVGFSMQ